jgi:hypothetical protein
VPASIGGLLGTAIGDIDSIRKNHIEFSLRNSMSRQVVHGYALNIRRFREARHSGFWNSLSMALTGQSGQRESSNKQVVTMTFTQLRWTPLMLDGIAILCRNGIRRRRGLATRVSERFIGKYGRRRKVERRAGLTLQTKEAESQTSEDSL